MWYANDKETCTFLIHQNQFVQMEVDAKQSEKKVCLVVRQKSLNVASKKTIKITIFM